MSYEPTLLDPLVRHKRWCVLTYIRIQAAQDRSHSRSPRCSFGARSANNAEWNACDRGFLVRPLGYGSDGEDSRGHQVLLRAPWDDRDTQTVPTPSKFATYLHGCHSNRPPLAPTSMQPTVAPEQQHTLHTHEIRTSSIHITYTFDSTTCTSSAVNFSSSCMRRCDRGNSAYTPTASAYSPANAMKKDNVEGW
ncbi:uncharacterized protein K489DRAFT_376915 [Dissoconium aciculare CBS 342.82]|uniref:Uncharacterized protein n=1 Tax=Dissoconium aciculare CBS 342.82 TaxID=1314786 RepID=A0A6J3MFR4_9PEZI|nr:uncharacterized protein K489DRAFT_376915 [Dissoconium aciculare CBS 342.82]KAF1826499.1 hypothetical protein K489DRAFT_376915 [Dissoconium aciculare CBS 342.82]